MRTDSQGGTTITVAVVLGALTFVVLSLRLFSRSFIIQHIGPDDILISIAALISWGFMVCNILGVHHGLGDHIEVMMARGPVNFSKYIKIVWISSMFYNASLGFIKCSVLALYARLGDRVLRRMAFIVMAICAVSATANVLICIFQCSPIRATWDQSITDAKCVNITAFYLANAATNIFTDILAYLLPMRLVRHLQVPKKQKIALGVMLCLGLFACLSSIIRITYIPIMLNSDDPTYVIAPPFYWSVIEINTGILAASIPSFKPLAKRYLPRLLGEIYNKGGNGYNGSAKPSKPSKPSKNSQHTDSSKFNKTSALELGGVRKGSTAYASDGIAIRDIRGDDPFGSQKGSDAFVTVSDRARAQSADSSASQTSRHSHSSEEHIIKPGQGNIVRTVEITQTTYEVDNRKSITKAPQGDW